MIDPSNFKQFAVVSERRSCEGLNDDVSDQTVIGDLREAALGWQLLGRKQPCEVLGILVAEYRFKGASRQLSRGALLQLIPDVELNRRVGELVLETT